MHIVEAVLDSWVTGVLVRFVQPPQVREAVRKVLSKPLCSAK